MITVSGVGQVKRNIDVHPSTPLTGLSGTSTPVCLDLAHALYVSTITYDEGTSQTLLDNNLWYEASGSHRASFRTGAAFAVRLNRNILSFCYVVPHMMRRQIGSFLCLGTCLRRGHSMPPNPDAWITNTSGGPYLAVVQIRWLR